MNEDFFIKKMKGVKPIRNNESLTKTSISKKKFYKKFNKQKIIDNKNNVEIRNKGEPEYNLSFGEINRDLKRGKIKIERKLDLHGYTVSDAYQKFKEEVIKSYHSNKRCILIITGKGVYLKKNEDTEDHRPRLFHGKIKNSIIDWIKEEQFKNYILTYQKAGIEHGGDGALFVYLRKNKS